MVVPSTSGQSWRAAFTGSYDDEVIELLVPYIKPESFVLDVGASLGFYTVPLALAAKRVKARIIAIEPVEGNCEILRRNVELNQLEDVVSVLRCALGTNNAQLTVHVEAGGAGNATIVSGLERSAVDRHDRAGNTWATETVGVVPLDELELPADIDDLPCSLIKADVEGFEMSILAGGGSFIRKYRPAIFAEFNPAWLETRGFPASAPATWAASNGYTCQELTCSRPNPASDRLTVSFTSLSASGFRSGSDLMLFPRS